MLTFKILVYLKGKACYDLYILFHCFNVCFLNPFFYFIIFLFLFLSNRLVSCDSLPEFDLSAWGQCEPGRWGNWSPWSSCVRGRQRSQRQCNSAPPPRGCGCEGPSTRFQRCSGRRCRRLVRFNNRSFWVWGRC